MPKGKERKSREKNGDEKRTFKIPTLISPGSPFCGCGTISDNSSNHARAEQGTWRVSKRLWRRVRLSDDFEGISRGGYIAENMIGSGSHCVPPYVTPEAVDAITTSHVEVNLPTEPEPPNFREDQIVDAAEQCRYISIKVASVNIQCDVVSLKYRCADTFPIYCFEVVETLRQATIIDALCTGATVSSSRSLRYQYLKSRSQHINRQGPRHLGSVVCTSSLQRFC